MNLNLFLLNANSVRNKVWQLESEIVLLHNYPDFIAITETWLTYEVDSDIFKFDAYTVYRRDRDDDPHGGVMLLVRENFASELIPRNSTIEILWVLVDFGTHRAVFGVYYRANVSHVHELDLLRQELTYISDHYPTACIVLVGDFNMPDVDWSQGVAPRIYKQDEYIDLFSAFNLTQVVDKPTRRDRILDLVLVSEPGSILKVETHPPIGRSDHEVVECVIAGESTGAKEGSHIGQYRYCWSRARWKELKQALRTINWWDIFLAEDLQDVNKLWTKFKCEMLKQIDFYVPKLSKKVHNRTSRLSKPALNAIREKRRAHRHYQRARLERDNNENANNIIIDNEKLAYQAAVRNVGAILAQDKLRKERNLANKPSLGKFYKFINSKLKYKQSVTSIRLPDGTVTTEEQKITEHFNEYFKSVFSAAADQYPEYRDLVQNPEMEDFIITRDDVERAIFECPDKCSSGCDGIPNIFYKKCASELSFPLLVVFTQTLATGSFPEEWRVSRVSPIFKKGSKLKVENYRPVSLTVVACRILERLIRNHILKFVLSNQVVSSAQHGFLPKRSTTTNLLKFLDLVTRKMDAGVSVNAIYLDIAKAFDTIPHDKLLSKLNSLGISEQIFIWVKNFLYNRMQYVELGGARSKEIHVPSGVPQGSVLGPLLFLVYFEAAGLNGPTGLLKFADDSKLFGSNAQDLQRDVDVFVRSIHELGMRIAVNKCCSVTYSCNGTASEAFTIHDQVIDSRSGEKDIGVYVDQQLKFSEHCQQITSKANSLSFRIFQSFATRDPKFLFSIFKTYVRPILEHNSTVWSPSLKEDIRRVEGPQRRFTKRLSGYETEFTYLQRLHALGEETLLVRRIKADLVLVYKIIHGLVDGLGDLIQFARVMRTRGHLYKIVPQRFRVNSRKNFFSVRVAHLWNDLPSEVVESRTLAIFKAKLKQIRYHEINSELFD
jgi:hypothetical protein